MELNGIANMLCILDKYSDEIDSVVTRELKDQLDILERYMCAYRKAQNDNKPAPEWSTVRDNRHLYPNNRGEVRDNVHNKS